MTLEELIRSDELALSLAQAGSDDACAKRVSEIAPKVHAEMRLTEIGLYKLLGPQLAESTLQKLESVAEQNRIVKRALSWLVPANGGLDFGDESTLAMLSQLHEDGVFTDDEYVAITSLSLVPQTISSIDITNLGLYQPQAVKR